VRQLVEERQEDLLDFALANQNRSVVCFSMSEENVRRILSLLGYDHGSIAMRMRIAKAGRNDEPSAVDTSCRSWCGNRPDGHNLIATQCDISDERWSTAAVDNGSALQKRIDFHSGFRSQDASDCLGHCSQCAGYRDGF